MENNNSTKSPAGGALASLFGEAPEKIEKAQIDEIQTPRRQSKRSENVDKLIQANPSLGRAWDRMEKNYKDFPYQELPTQEGESVIKRALRGLERQMNESEPTIQPRPPLKTDWIYGDESPDQRLGDVEDVVIKSTQMQVEKPAKREEPEQRVFLAFEKVDGVLTIELAWSIQTDRGTTHKGHENVIVMKSGDTGAVGQMREFKELIKGKTVSIWQIPPFYEAMNEFITPEMAPEFEPLHFWLKASGFMRFAMDVYSVEEEERDRLTLDCLRRRFGISAEPFRKNKNAYLLLRLWSMMGRDMISQEKNLAVAPLELDQTPSVD